MTVAPRELDLLVDVAMSETLKIINSALNEYTETYATAGNGVRVLRERHGWQEGIAGFDLTQDERVQLADVSNKQDYRQLRIVIDALRSRRPLDPFVIEDHLSLSLVEVNDRTADDLRYFVRLCAIALSQVPAAQFYDFFRASYVFNAAQLASHAILKAGRAEPNEIEVALSMWAVFQKHFPLHPEGGNT